MARIRSIKPEFSQTEKIGRLTRDARLLFIQLWTVVDDDGRARAASRMLASLLYPYDDDAKDLIDGWLIELEREGCIRRYKVAGAAYLEVIGWQEHQKIDRPTPSRLPGSGKGQPFSPVEKPREPSRVLDADLGPRIKDPGVSHPPDARPPADTDDAVIAVEIYNTAAAETQWPTVQRLTPQRRAAVNARLRECGGIPGWQAAIDKGKASAFLCGGNGDGWRADFDFICRSKSFTKIMEGSYDDRKPTPDNKPRPHDTLFSSLAEQVPQEFWHHQRQANPDVGNGTNGFGTPADSGPSIELEATAYRRAGRPRTDCG